MQTLHNPPGLDGDLEHYTSGGDDVDWLPMKEHKKYTNAFIIKDGKILLGYKKRGFGKDMYNGFGGKVEGEETSLQAAVRELQEEAGIKAPLNHAGLILFLSEGVDRAFEIEIFRGDEYSGVVVETDEMRPEWFDVPTDLVPNDVNARPIPVDKMWASDRFWFPLLLSNKTFAGRVDFVRDGEKFVLHKWWYGKPRHD